MSGTQAAAGSRITAAWLNLNIPGDWVPITPASGWSNHGGTSVTFQARKFNSVTLEIIGILGASAQGQSGTIGSLPPTLPYPVTVQPGTAEVFAGTGAGGSVSMSVDNNGVIACTQAVSGNEIGFHFFVSLDA